MPAGLTAGGAEVEAAVHIVRAPGQQAQIGARLSPIVRLAQHSPVDDDHRVHAQHQLARRQALAGHHLARLAARVRLDGGTRIAVVHVLIVRTDDHAEGDAKNPQQLLPLRRARGKDEARS